MAEKKEKKRNATERERKAKMPYKPAPIPAPLEEAEPDNGMDFGGLPNRDLKKNLGGCG